jgi:cell division protein FtsL
MLRFVNICLVLGLVALAYVIYQVKYEARALDEQIVSLNKDIESERDSVAVLRAEWSLLNRPERIERLAKKYLKLAPTQPQQLVILDEVKDRDFERSRIEPPAAQASALQAASEPPAGATKAAAN